jgi:hypothetical protein
MQKENNLFTLGWIFCEVWRCRIPKAEKRNFIIRHSLFEIEYSETVNKRLFSKTEPMLPSWGLPDALRYAGGDSLRFAHNWNNG